MENTRTCDHKGCRLAATHALMWAKWMYYCVNHAQLALIEADELGIKTPGNTIRPIAECEMEAGA